MLAWWTNQQIVTNAEVLGSKNEPSLDNIWPEGLTVNIINNVPYIFHPSIYMANELKKSNIINIPKKKKKMITSQSVKQRRIINVEQGISQCLEEKHGLLVHW